MHVYPETPLRNAPAPTRSHRLSEEDEQMTVNSAGVVAGIVLCPDKRLESTEDVCNTPEADASKDSPATNSAVGVAASHPLVADPKKALHRAVNAAPFVPNLETKMSSTATLPENLHNNNFQKRQSGKQAPGNPAKSTRTTFSSSLRVRSDNTMIHSRAFPHHWSGSGMQTRAGIARTDDMHSGFPMPPYTPWMNDMGPNGYMYFMPYPMGFQWPMIQNPPGCMHAPYHASQDNSFQTRWASSATCAQRFPDRNTARISSDSKLPSQSLPEHLVVAKKGKMYQAQGSGMKQGSNGQPHLNARQRRTLRRAKERASMELAQVEVIQVDSSGCSTEDVGVVALAMDEMESSKSATAMKLSKSECVAGRPADASNRDIQKAQVETLASMVGTNVTPLATRLSELSMLDIQTAPNNRLVQDLQVIHNFRRGKKSQGKGCLQSRPVPSSSSLEQSSQSSGGHISPASDQMLSEGSSEASESAADCIT